MIKIVNKYVSLLLLFFTLSCNSEADLSEQYNRLNKIEQQITNAERLTKIASKEIETIQALLNALNKRLNILSYTQTPAGYELVMSDGGKLHLTNAGETIIGTKKYSDNNLYWTLDGEFLLDENGNKIPMSGNKGESGTTPKLRVNANNEWEVSIDNGNNWTAVKGADGQPVFATGKKRESGIGDLKISETEDTINIHFNGTDYKIAKVVNKRPKLPIEYFAEYNVGKTPGTFSNSHNNDSSGYYSFADAKMAIPAGYILPSPEKMNIVFPSIVRTGQIPNDSDANIFFKQKKSIRGVFEYLWGKMKDDLVGTFKHTFLCDYENTGNGITYARRYRGHGDELQAAYRYQLIGDMEESNPDSHLQVVVRYLGTYSEYTMEDICDEAFWNQPDTEYITRIFPATGFFDIWDKNVIDKGVGGYYWSSYDSYTSDENRIWWGFFNEHVVHTFGYSDAHAVIRPFSLN